MELGPIFAQKEAIVKVEIRKKLVPGLLESAPAVES
jgi:hypothetical protein